ncbi:MAG: hypothetical protein A2015_17055 [Spirochaetes bacterium GWF1_31_7]|nr:MAG: hypothetical protein A2Y30_14420 [Spirochaetes bacterium GWE1_32_154]OHD50150.1 MAG: hypothetical protein A2Y29_12465 [Spirochaetes bacterium GWE2_31_10]OHD52464.1 MAG: hypothetical protein A2015_17055 [Spirochaetes bacterium GWF1_31_7]OHD81958.1 MAG: hypothetical protein A2355_17680 [Spirochaetes bacterium RIFOXYB1_FULL_32_8]
MDNTDKLLEMVFSGGYSLEGQLVGLSAAINILFAAIIGFLIIGVYILTTDKGKKDLPLVQSIPVLSILMSVIMRIDGSRAAIFFGIFGILSIVRFRSELTDQKGITFILFSIIMGLLSGMGNFILAGVSFVIISSVIIIIRYSFKSGRYKAANLIFSGDLGLSDIEKIATETLILFKIDYEFTSASEKINKLNDTKKEVEYLMHSKNVQLMLSLYNEMNVHLKEKGVNLEFRTK